MKKILTFYSLVLLILLGGPALSQNQHVKMGVKVAPNIGWMNSDTKGYEYDGITGGATLGFISEFYFMEHYAFVTGFNFSFLNGKLKYPSIVIQDGDTLPGILNRKYDFTYLEIPVLLKMKTKKYGKFSFFAQLGVGTAFRIKCRAKDTFHPENQSSFTEKNDITGQTTLMRESIIVGLGTEFHIDESTVLLFGFNYNNTLNNVLNSNNPADPDVKEKGLLNFAELSIGVLF